MSTDHDLTTLSEVMNALGKRGIHQEFKLTKSGFQLGESKFYNPQDLTIIKTYRFEGETDPGDSSILYLIKTNDDLIGYNIDSYGVYSEHENGDFNNFIRQIPVANHESEILFKL
ncbi:MAG: hypothetical protein ABIP68_04415 [Ferruginibacter sp.]